MSRFAPILLHTVFRPVAVISVMAATTADEIAAQRTAGHAVDLSTRESLEENNRRLDDRGVKLRLSEAKGH